MRTGVCVLAASVHPRGGLRGNLRTGACVLAPLGAYFAKLSEIPRPGRNLIRVGQNCSNLANFSRFSLEFRSFEFPPPARSLVAQSSFSGSHKVLRTSRLQTGAPGEKWSEGECLQWEDEAMTFLGKRFAETERDGARAKKRARQEHKVERLASLDVLRVWQNSLVCHTTMGLERWVEVESPAPGFVPPFLAISQDWSQVQWCPLWFLRNHVRLYIEAVPDATHVRHRNVDLATAMANERVTVAKAHCCNNVRSGPWQGAAYGRDLEDAALAISNNFGPNDPLLLFYWDDIRRDLCLDAGYEGTPGRERFLRELPTLRHVDVRPPKSSPSRWCSFQHACAFMDKFWAVDNLLLAFVCIQKKWVDTLDQLLPKPKRSPLFDMNVHKAEKTPTIVKSVAFAQCIVASSAGASSSSSGGVQVDKQAKPDAPTSAARARAKVLQERQRAKNTLHCVAQYRADKNFHHRVRRLCLVSAPEADAHSDFCKNVLGSDEVKRFFAGAASGNWLNPLCETVRTMQDLQGLAKCGFKCEFADIEGLEENSALVQFQDAEAHGMMRFMVGILHQRCASCSWHCDGWPGALGLLVHQDQCKVEQGLDKLRVATEAVEYARKSGPTGLAMSERSLLNGAFMTAVLRLAREGGFKVLSPALAGLMSDFWGGLLQTVVCERANQRLRDCETRDCPSKTMARTKRWEALRRSPLTSMYKRDGLTIERPEQAPRNADMSSLFQHVDKNPPLPLADICKKQIWQTWSAQSIRTAFAEQQVMIKAKETGNPSLFNKAWVASIVPEGQLILIRKHGVVSDAFLSLANEKVAVQGWPVEKADLFVVLASARDKVPAVEWKVLDDIDSIFVVPTKSASPLHAMIRKAKLPSLPIGCHLLTTGMAEPVVRWQARQGFANVGEDALRKLKQHLKVRDKVVVAQGMSLEDALAAELIMHCEPDITVATMSDRLHKRKILENGTGDETVSALSQEVVDDCMLLSDRRTIMGEIEGEKRQARQRVQRSGQILALMRSLEPTLKKSAKPKCSNAAKHVQQAKKKSGHRWWANIEGDPSFITDFMPDSGVVVVDNQDGRFMLHHAGIPGSRRSISWTTRGMELACRDCLRQLWSWEVSLTGGECPLPPEMLGDLIE